MAKYQIDLFENTKNEPGAKPVVQSCSLTKEATVTTGDPKKAIGGVLSQGGHLVFYFSKKLSQAEQNYSNFDCEALATGLWAKN